MDKTKRGTWKTSVLFSVVVFLILVITLCVMGGILILLLHLGIFPMGKPIPMLVSIALISIAIGTVLSAIVGRRLLAPIVEIGEATKRVAKGDFSVVMSDNSRSEEVRVMVRNFNIMTHELASTELFRNDFISNVSHEFKTPLSAIEGYAMLLQNKALSEDKRELYTSKIISNTRRLATLTGNILQLSRLESQQIAPDQAVFSLDEQIREIVILFEDVWNKKQIDLDLDLDTVNYYGNSELISQVWQNLIGNALKFSNDKGNILIRMKKSKDSILVSVADSGIGMSPETSQRIFEKFYQGDTSHETEGNGLGLTLVKRIVDLYNGKVEVISEPDKGTTFTVTLPIKKQS